MLTNLLKYIFFSFFFFFAIVLGFAQNNSDLQEVDTFKLKLLRDYEQWSYNYATQKLFDSSNVYAERALNLALEIDNADLLAFAKNGMATNLYFQAKTEQARIYIAQNLSGPKVHDSILKSTYFLASDIAFYEKKFKKTVDYLFSLETLVSSNALNSQKDSLTMASIYRRFGDVHKQLKEYDKAHGYYSQASDLIDDSNSESYMVYYTAELFEEENKLDSAIAETKRALTMVSNGEDGKLYRPTYYLKLSNLYLKLKKYDSAVYYGTLGLKDNDDCQLDLLNMSVGDGYFASKNYQLANKHYNEAIHTAVSINTELKVREKLRENHRMLNNYEEALEENSLFLKLKDSIDKSRISQEIADITEKYESSKKQLEIDRLELENIKQTGLIDKQESKILYGSTVLVLSVIILTLLLVYYLKQKQQKHQLFLQNRQLVQQLQLSVTKTKTKKEGHVKINDHKLEKICALINNLIDEAFYLDHDMSLNKMAKSIDTNTTYLSKIINDTYGKTFSNFLNDLRISYALKKFESDEEFQRLTIEHISDKSGFASSSTFYSAFKKHTGLTPSYYIKKSIAQKGKNLLNI